MNKKRNMDSGRKSARPDYIQKTIKFRKTQWKSFLPQNPHKDWGDYNFCTSAWVCRKQVFPVCQQNRQREGEGRISFRCR